MKIVPIGNTQKNPKKKNHDYSPDTSGKNKFFKKKS